MSDFNSLKEIIGKEIKTIRELNEVSDNLVGAKAPAEKAMLKSQVNLLKDSLRKTNDNLSVTLNKVFVAKPLGKQKTMPVAMHKMPSAHVVQTATHPRVRKHKSKKRKNEVIELEEETLRRLKKGERKEEKKKERKASKYVQTSNKLFSKLSGELLEKGGFGRNLERDLSKANLQFLPKTYLSVVFFTTLLAGVIGFFLFIFLLFFSVSAKLPFISIAEGGMGARFLKVFWILFAAPLGTFIFMYLYPAMEKASLGYKIDQELPFATIHMSSIAGSMIEPSKIFTIIISTHEYPHLEKQFVKLMNQLNVFGYDLVTALRNIGSSSPSKKLSELFNGLATTITSGGNLPEFFNKRAETLLFDYRLEREKHIKSSETFMDIYISVVIAAPMILMLLLMMMKISGLGIQLSTGMITLIMILGVSVINIAFLTFLSLKQPGGT